ncbi:5-formyltetrahydrofolate cyclo-ligase-like isoform X1 [Notechis scutatus]|uniref:5-formyltetrahydrofolate cyclo-ligase n=1 Tax=Notechis scutatus TaxID=8663 RepID=A0A6J1UPD7_9SAUR|nr:5-formyltetrahydrofolate cyclo-ligase-like isoform X1 [Notechis scutatus]
MTASSLDFEAGCLFALAPLQAEGSQRSLLSPPPGARGPRRKDLRGPLRPSSGFGAPPRGRPRRRLLSQSHGELGGGRSRRKPGRHGSQTARSQTRPASGAEAPPGRAERSREAAPVAPAGRQGGWVMVHPCYLSSRRIAVFLSMPDEVQTNEIIKDIFQKGKECFIPWYKPQSSHMDMVKLASYEEIASLPLTSWNIHQPAEDNRREDALATADGLDLILMPGLGFDKMGNRLGRGKGYYDTYLQRCLQHPKGKPYTIALAFQEQVCGMVPVSETDMKVDEILFEGFENSKQEL